MPRLSLYRPNKGNDYRFTDRTISEMFQVGGTDIHVHKYLGPQSSAGGNSATEPAYDSDSITNIQDLLFLENRDRKYDTSIYTIRGVYRVSDNDFDLSQFGLFLTGDTIFMVFHLNNMVETLGRKIIVGDVFELPHITDYYPLDDDLPTALKRYYVVQDATLASEGFSVTWYPHLWRVKLQPLVDSQEYKDIIGKIKAGENSDDTLGDVLSTLDRYLNINDSIVERAESDVPASGYDTTFIYNAPVNSQGYPGDPEGLDTSIITEDASDTTNGDASAATVTPTASVSGYLTGDVVPPNGSSVAAGIAFPDQPVEGEYFLREDYSPNRLFRYTNSRWIKIEDNVRTSLTPGTSNKTQRSSFVNNTNARMKDAIVWDAIRISDPYIAPANAATISFSLSSNAVVTNVTFNSSFGVRTYLNGIRISNTVSNSSGNIGFTVSNTLEEGSVLEYTVYETVIPEQQGLSTALRPDN